VHGTITLGQVAARLVASVHILTVSCNRRGRLRLDHLLAEHGPDLPVPELRGIIAADCRALLSNARMIRVACISPSCRLCFGKPRRTKFPEKEIAAD
jgi:hypothetical protein